MTGTRFPNCPICQYYHTDYPYCDMCKDENRFEFNNEKFESILMDYGDFPKKISISTNCLICGEPVPMEHMGDYPKICEKCKEAVKFARREIEAREEMIEAEKEFYKE